MARSAFLKSIEIIKKIRSPREKLGGYVILPRLIDKVRLHARGELPKEYIGNLLGKEKLYFDKRLLDFTSLDGEKLREAILASKTDLEVLSWVEKNGVCHTEEEKMAWFRQIEAYRPGPEARDVRKKNYPELSARIDIGAVNAFDMIDMDEGRLPLK